MTLHTAIGGPVNPLSLDPANIAPARRYANGTVERWSHAWQRLLLSCSETEQLTYASLARQRARDALDIGNNVKIRFYGRLADLFGSEREMQIETPCTVAELRQHLASNYPQAAETLQNKRIRACIGDAIVQDADLIPEGEVLELLAPVSGG
jgi:molybdopterin converting factor small subunit